MVLAYTTNERQNLYADWCQVLKAWDTQTKEKKRDQILNSYFHKSCLLWHWPLSEAIINLLEETATNYSERKNFYAIAIENLTREWRFCVNKHLKTNRINRKIYKNFMFPVTNDYDLMHSILMLSLTYNKMYWKWIFF